ncbi:MAG: hypothetical protein ACOYOV_11245 [Bacteroidales bacterium]
MQKIIFISDKINLENLLSTNPPFFYYTKDKFALIISLVSENLIQCKDDHQTRYVLIPAKQFQHITKDYKLYLEYLIKYNVITTDNTYYVGEKSKGYTYTETYQTALAPYYVTDTTLIRKINKTELARFDNSAKLSFLSRWFNNMLTINYVKAKAENLKLFQLNLKKANVNAYKKFAHAELSIEKLNSHKFLFNRDTTSYRIHTNITSINKHFRQFISYDNQPLVSLDFSNAQPFFSSVLFNKNFYDKNYAGLNLYKLNPTIYNEMIRNKSLKEIINFLDNIKEDSDIHSFIRHAIAGDLYKHIVDIFNNNGNNSKFEITDIKKMIFVVFFSSNYFRQNDNFIYKNIFKINFSNVYEVFKMIKRGDNSRLPVILQTIESHLVIDLIAKRISIEFPDLPIFTIHDSIITLKGYEFILKPIIDQISLEIIGRIPNLKIEYWESCEDE